MLAYGLLLTFVGMGAVFAFLLLLAVTVRFSSWIVRQTECSSAQLDKVAASIAIALSQGGR